MRGELPPKHTAPKTHRGAFDHTPGRVSLPPGRSPQASAPDWDGPRPGRDRTHTCGPGPPSQPKKCHLQMGRRGKSEKTGRRKVNRHMGGILGGRVTAWGEKIGLSHGSGRQHRPGAWMAGRTALGWAGFAMCAVASEEAGCWGWRGC